MSDPNWPGVGKFFDDWVKAGMPPAPTTPPDIQILGANVPCHRVLGHGEYCSWGYLLCSNCRALLKLSGQKDPSL